MSKNVIKIEPNADGEATIVLYGTEYTIQVEGYVDKKAQEKSAPLKSGLAPATE